MRLLRRALGNPFISGLLAVVLVFILILFFLQWFLIGELLGLTIDLVETELIEQKLDGVEASEITRTFERVRQSLLNMPKSYITGKLHLKKVTAAAEFAKKANEDGEWTPEEVNTLLRMMNAAVGFKRGEK
jgi:hypothetical protein